MSDLRTKAINAFGWDFSGRLASHGMSFVVSIFLARLLEPSEFGLIAMVMVIIGMASIFTDIGLGGALIQRRRVLPVHYSSVFYFNVFAGLLLTCITYFSAGWIGEFYDNETLIPLAKILSLLFVINSFRSVQAVKLRKELNYQLLVKLGFTASLISGVIGVSLAFAGFGVWSLVAQSLTQGLVYNILIWSFGRWVPSMSFSFKALKQLWGFGFRMFLSGFLDAIFTRLDFLVIGKMFPAETLGFFQRAKSLNFMVVQYSSASLMSVLFPVLSEIQKDLPRFQNTVLKSLGIICFVVFLLLGGLYLVSAELITLLFGEKWLPSVRIFEVLVISGFALPISSLLVNVLSSRGNSKAFLRLEILKKILLTTNLVVLMIWGIEVYLYGLIVQATLGVSLNIHFAAREIKLSQGLFFKPIVVQALLSVVAIFVTLLVMSALGEWHDFLLLLFKGVVFALTYLAVNWLLDTNSFRDLQEQLIPIWKRKIARH